MVNEELLKEIMKIKINKNLSENHIDFSELEKDWRKSLPKMSDKELLSAFPEAKEIIPVKIKEWQEELDSGREKLRKELVYIYHLKSDDFSTWFLEQTAKLFLMPEINTASRNLLRLKRLSSLSTPWQKTKNWQEDIETARVYPIEKIAEAVMALKKCGNSFNALCPFHNEKHPSFYLYPKTNTFYCFGCQEKGDVIKLTMHLHGINFKEAVRMLQN